METKNIGLRGIEVADTRISNIDGEKGKLIYRGYDILDLTKNSTFEETAFLLLYDHLPTKTQLDEFTAKLVDARFIPKQMQKNMGNWRKDADPMDMLQAFVSALAGYYDEEFANKEASYDKAINLIAKVPTIIASWQRIRNGLDIVDPDPSLSHAANFLYMMSGEKPDPEVEKIFDVCLILHAGALQISPLMHQHLLQDKSHQLELTCILHQVRQLAHLVESCMEVQTPKS